MRKVASKKRKVLNIDELRAYRVAYGRQLGSKDYLMYVGVPAGLFGLLSLLLLYNVWVTLVCISIGAIYGWTFFLPKSVRKQYEAESFNQRNKFINNITQVLTDENHTVLMALQKVTPRADGEFQEDVKRFHAMLIGADNQRVRDAVNWFSDEYEDDVIFLQYLEQLETACIEGKTNIDTLKDIKSYHNDIRKKQLHYEKRKAGHLRDMKQLLGITCVLIIALALSFGFDTYLEAFARTTIGYITSGLYLTILAFFFKQFSNYLFDDSVMEIRVGR